MHYRAVFNQNQTEMEKSTGFFITISAFILLRPFKYV